MGPQQLIFLQAPQAILMSSQVCEPLLYPTMQISASKGLTILSHDWLAHILFIVCHLSLDYKFTHGRDFVILFCQCISSMLHSTWYLPRIF